MVHILNLERMICMSGLCSRMLGVFDSGKNYVEKFKEKCKKLADPTSSEEKKLKKLKDAQEQKQYKKFMNSGKQLYQLSYEMGLKFAKIIDYCVKNKISIVDNVQKDALTPYTQELDKASKKHKFIITEERYKKLKKLFKIIKNLNDTTKDPATKTLDRIVNNGFKAAYVKKGKLLNAD